MRRPAVLIAIAAWAAGCADQPPAAAPAAADRTPATAQMTCQSGWSFGDKRYFVGDWRERSLIAGPLTLLWLNGHAGRELRRPRAFNTKVLLEPRATTTVAVSAEDRGHVSLATHPPNGTDTYFDAEPAIRFEGCEPRVDDTREGEEQGTGYLIAVMVDGPRCATFEITPEGGETIRRRAGFGVRCG